MLPSSGYFQSVVCPFFKSGLCERPHCHFKHAKTGVVGKSQLQWAATEGIDINDEPEGKPDLFSVLNRTESELEQIEIKSEPFHSYILPSVEKYPVKPSGILKTAAIKQEKHPIVPEYKPTPISQLKQLNPDIKPSLESLVPSDATGSRKRKKFDEYDPEEVKYSKKRVSFNLPDEDYVDGTTVDNVITIESSDDDGDSAPAKFSDDDFEDDEVQIWSGPKTESKSITETVNSVKEAPEEPKKEISEFSLVDKILVDVSRNEEFIKGFNKPHRVMGTSNPEKTIKALCPKPAELDPSEGAKSLKGKSIVCDSLKEKSLTNKTDKNISKPLVNDANKGKPEKNSSKEKIRIGDKVDKSVKGDRKKSSHSENVKNHNDDKSNTEEKVKCIQTEKTKSSKDKSKDEKIQSSKAIKNSKDVKEKDKKILKEEKSKSSKEGKLKDSKEKSRSTDKDEKVKSSSKDATHRNSKEAAVRTTKSEKCLQKDHTRPESKKSKTSIDAKDKLVKDKSEKTKSSNNPKHELEDGKNVKDSKSVKMKYKDHELTTKEKSSSKSSKKITSIENADKSVIKKKEPKKIQDEKISSSSVIKTDKGTDLKYSISKQGNMKTVSPKSTRPKESDLFHKDSIADLSKDSDDSDAHSDTGDIGLGSSDSEVNSDTYEECWRIFNEANAPSTEEPKVFEESSQVNESPDDIAVLSGKKKKKRLAHQNEFKRTAKSSSGKEKQKLNPAQIMHNRYLQLQEMYAKQNEKNDSSSFLSSINKNNADGQKKRIAVAPSSSLVAAVAQKNKLLSCSGNSSSASSHTVVTTIKGAKRVAHVPTAAMSQRPIIPAVYGSKVATNIRQRYLNNFIDECLKFCVTEDQAYEMALDEEKRAYDRSTNKTIYLNVAANALNRLRHRAREGPPAELPDDAPIRPTVSSTTHLPDTMSKKTVSHETILAGPRRFTYSIERRKTKAPEILIKGVLLYNCLLEYLLTEEQLIENGFPLPHPTEPGRAVISGIYANKQPTSNDPFVRICCRCSKSYYVDEDGRYVKPEECDFHWGRIYKRRIAGSIESRYMCCQGDSESEGCCVGPGHVFEGSDSHLLKGFVKTLPKSPPPDKYYGVYSLDCEMCYTTAGIELTRVTVIGPDMNSVFETFVKPEHEVLDYNSRFSGITEDDLVGITTSIRDVQAILLCMFNEKTILIGHSLESDFKALKLIHKTVVDTSVVFPHKMGLPYKRALRTLMAEKCNKIIQNSIGGHDSHEDAAACMELMLWKIKEDMKFSSR